MTKNNCYCNQERSLITFFSSELGPHMSVVAIDWSGAKRPAGKIWLAEASSGQIDRLEPLKSREKALQQILAFGQANADVIVGVDFAFSFPAWFFRQHNLASALELWRVVKAEGERWLSSCEPPFWGRSGTKKPKLESHYRRTEENILVAGHRPKSCFQINGGGTVGTGSIRGMPFLIEIRQAGFAVWPFDAPKTPLVLEIYPRALTGVIVKSSPKLRAEYLLDHWPALRSSMRDLAANSEDAFDAAVSALVMDSRRQEFAALKAADELGKLEGEIWLPLKHTNTLRPTAQQSE